MQCILVIRALPQGFERILKKITHMGISIMLKSQGQAIDENALYFGAK